MTERRIDRSRDTAAREEVSKLPGGDPKVVFGARTRFVACAGIAEKAMAAAVASAVIIRRMGNPLSVIAELTKRGYWKRFPELLC